MATTTSDNDDVIPPNAQFDQYADDYDAALNQGLTATGEGKDYFARGRIEWLARRVRELNQQPRQVMDYGCGDGSSVPLLSEFLKPEHVIGVDTSARSLDVAKRLNGSADSGFSLISEYRPDGALDLVYCNGVFHHIPVADRAQAAQFIWQSLRPDGLFALWENNPWNPGTRYVMSRIPFDRDAITLTPPESAALLCSAGFELLRTDFLFFFPRQLSFFRRIEPLVRKIPLGGQYLVLARKINR